jgi:glucoamylase
MITAIENFANQGGMITEQLWDVADLPDGSMKLGRPTGAAMLLCWSHAEYITLVRSRHDGVCFDRVEPAFQRYVVHPAQSSREIWSFRHQLRRIPHQKTLRIIVGAPATVVWSADNWATTNRSDTLACPGLNLQSVDLPSNTLASGRFVEFTFFWTADQRWEGRNWQIAIQ